MADWETSGKDEEKSVGYNCCHRSQMCPGKLAYIHSSAAGRRTKGGGGRQRGRGGVGVGVGGGNQPSTIFRCSRRHHVLRYSFHLISDGIPLNTLNRVHKHGALGASCGATFACAHVSVGSSSPSRLNLGRPLLEGWLCAAPGAQWAQLSWAVIEAPSARVSLSPRSSFVPPPSPLFIF